MFDARSALTKFNVLTTRPRDNENGLVGWWTFDDGTATDWSGNQNNGTLVGSPIVIGGIIGNALTFNGSSNYVDIGAPADLELYSLLTISHWVSTTSATSPIFTVAKDFSTGARGFAFGLGGGKAFAQMGGSTVYNAGPLINNGAWHHLIFMIAGGNLLIYIDGFLLSTTAVGGLSANTSAHWEIGQRSYVGFTNGFPGSIDDVRVYNRIPSDAEINAIYNQGLAYQKGQPEGEMPAMYKSSAFLAARARNRNAVVQGVAT